MTVPGADPLLPFRMMRQPDLTSCGPTCLQSVYAYWGDPVPLARLVDEVTHLEEGGTLGVLLAQHALQRGYRATLYTYNLRMFDPTWFNAEKTNLADRLRRQAALKKEAKLELATRAYLSFLAAGGEVRFDDISLALLRRYLRKGIPIMTGLSSTYLYHACRERQDSMQDDDLGGEPTGHFVVLCGYRGETRRIVIADPYHPNPLSDSHLYEVSMERVLGAILLGTITYDGNLLVIRPRMPSRNRSPAV